MKSLSQSDFADFRNLYESMYTPKEEFEINEELIDAIFDELVEEFIEEGYSEEDAIEIVDEAVDAYIDEVLCEVSDSYYDSAVRASKKAAKGIDKAARQKRRAGQARYYKRKAGEALKAAGDKVKGAVAGAQKKASAAKAGVEIAGVIAKDETKRAGRKAVHAATTAPGKAKKGLKGFIKRQAQKVVNRMSEEYLDETGKNDARIRDNINRFKKSKVEYTPPRNWDPEANRGQGATVSPKQAEKRRRKSLRQEELEATGLFSEREIEAIMEADSLAAMQARRDAEYKAGTKKEEVGEVDEAMSSYDRNRKRAAQRAAARNAARDAGKTGVVPGVGYVTPRRERETYVDSAGTTRHKSGAKMPKD